MDNSEKRASASEKVRAQYGGRDTLFSLSNLPKIVELRLEIIQANPDQPRKTFVEAGIRELANSIESHGLIQPITVRRLAEDDGYMVIAGERRLRAFQLLKRQTVPAIISTGNADEIALIENLQREDLKPLEEAEALDALRQRHGYTQDELARIVSKAKSTISELLSLMDLPEAIKADVRTSELPISKSVLIEVSRLKNEPEQLQLWEQVKTGRATVRTARAHKESGGVRETLTPLAKTLAAARSFARRLEKLSTEDLVTNRDQYMELLDVKQRLDDLMAEHTARGGELHQELARRITHSLRSEV
jgi:ParB family transcriptional regulator, chromosome partitioning protein